MQVIVNLMGPAISPVMPPQQCAYPMKTRSHDLQYSRMIKVPIPIKGSPSHNKHHNSHKVFLYSRLREGQDINYLIDCFESSKRRGLSNSIIIEQCDRKKNKVCLYIVVVDCFVSSHHSDVNQLVTQCMLLRKESSYRNIDSRVCQMVTRTMTLCTT